MEHSDIPGYFYDAEKKRYFKIEKHDLPAFVTQTSVTNHSASEQVNQCVKRIRDLVKPLQSTNFSSLLCRFERRGFLSIRSLASDYSRIHLHRFRNHSSLSIQPISHCLLSPTGSHLHGSSPNLFTSYRMFWSQCDSSGERQLMKKKRKRRLKNDTDFFLQDIGRFHVQNVSTVSLSGLLMQDSIWRRPDQEIIALCDVMGEVTPISVTLQDTPTGFRYQLDPKRGTRLPYSGSAKLIHYVTQSGEVDDNPFALGMDPLFEDGTILMWTRMGVYRIGDAVCFPLYTTFNRKRAKLERKVHITACSPLWCDSFRSSGIQLYLSTSATQGNKELSLIQMGTYSLERPHKLIEFGCSARFNMEITHVQPLVTKARNRLGVLTRSLSGLLQLWDDRWPEKPVMSYPGSDCGQLHMLASHVVPQPVVDVDLLNCVACPLPACGNIAMWDIWSGNPIHVLELASLRTRSSFDPPPFMFLRSSWPNLAGEQVRGPGLLVLDQTEMHWFHAD